MTDIGGKKTYLDSYYEYRNLAINRNFKMLSLMACKTYFFSLFDLPYRTRSPFRQMKTPIRQMLVWYQS